MKKEGDKKVKIKLIAALTIATLLFIVVGSTALAQGYFTCKACGEYTTFTFLGFEKIDETYHSTAIRCNACGGKGSAGQWPHTGGTATCAKAAVCNECKEEYGDKLGYHNVTDLVLYGAKTPTCTEGGWDDYVVCRICNYSTKKEIPPLKHDYGDWVSNDNGTHTRACTRDNSHTETESCGGGTASCNARAVCEKCGAQYGEKDPNHHDLVPHEAKTAICTEIGWDAYDTCRNCSYTTYAEIPVAGHSIEHHEAKNATCTEVGWKAYDTCSHCDYTTYDELPALSHDYKERVYAPTCEKAGYTLHTCSRCDDRYMTDRVARSAIGSANGLRPGRAPTRPSACARAAAARRAWRAKWSRARWRRTVRRSRLR